MTECLLDLTLTKRKLLSYNDLHLYQSKSVCTQYIGTSSKST